MLKQSETRASKAWSGRSSGTACATVRAKRATSRAKIASHSSGVIVRPGRTVGGPTAEV